MRKLFLLAAAVAAAALLAATAGSDPPKGMAILKLRFRDFTGCPRCQRLNRLCVPDVWR